MALQFAPDLDPATQGVLMDCVNVVPTQKGLAGCYTGINTSYPVLAASCRNLIVTVKLDNSRRFFATTQTNIYEGSAGAWTAVAAGTPDIGAEYRWSFGQFGDVTLAVAKTVNLQASSSGAFSTVSGAPKASHIATGQGFVMLADTNEGTYGDQSDRWWCSGYYDHTSWTPSVTTQCTTGRLTDTPGPITGLVGYGGNFVVFKQDSIYLGSYTGAPSVFTWNLVPGQIGCRSKDAIAQAGPLFYFLGNDNFYMWDGSRAIPVGNPLREWFFKSEVNPAYLYKVMATYDKPNQFVWFFYVPSGETTLQRAVVFHIPTGKWGKVHLAIEAAATYLSDPITIDGLDTLSSTIDGLPAISFDSPYWSSQSQVMAYADIAHQVKTMTGDCATSSFQTGSLGDVEVFSFVNRLKPRFVTPPTSATATHQYDNDYGDNWTTGTTATLTNGAFDLMWSARWHNFIIEFVGNWELIDVKVVHSSGSME